MVLKLITKVLPLLDEMALINGYEANHALQFGALQSLAERFRGRLLWAKEDMREFPMLDALNQVLLRLLTFGSEQTRSRAIKFLNVLKLFIAKLTEWDNLEGNLPSQNREGVKDQTLSKAGTRDAENVASPVYHTTQDTNLCVFRFSILPGVHVLEDELQAQVENPPLILYELIFISRENYIWKFF